MGKESSGVVYVSNTEYKVLREEERHLVTKWWYKGIWKFKCTHKNKKIMWYAINNAIAT